MMYISMPVYTYKDILNIGLCEDRVSQNLVVYHH